MRYHTLDFFKAIAAFSVISLHVGYYKELGHIWGELIRLSGRWAVPFFFMVTGYMIGTKGDDALDLNRKIPQLIRMLVFTSLIFIPCLWIQEDADWTGMAQTLLSYKLISQGSYFHLWYLSSLILGLLMFKTLSEWLTPRTVLVISTIILVINFVFDAWRGFESGFSRHLISFSCIYYGYRLSQVDPRSVQVPLLLLLLVLSGGMIFIEPYLIFGDASRAVIARQFPIGVIPFCATLVLIGAKSNFDENRISAIGRDHALLIYLLHPMFLLFLQKVMTMVEIKSSLLQLVAGFILSLMFSYLLKVYCQPVFKLFSGR
jgi:surface polysaccharide O-acyltransferase-like enzyme